MIRESIRAGAILWVCLFVFFYNIVFLGSTFLTSAFNPATMPDGPYGYQGHHISSSSVPVRDGGASAWHTEPLNRLVAQMYQSGELPLWNPFIGGGVPLAANMQSGTFFPLNALPFLAPVDMWALANDLSGLIGFFIAGFFTYLFLRRVGAGPVGALGAAIAYMFCGRLVLYVQTADWRVDLLIPLLLYASERLCTRTTLTSIIFVAGSVFLSVVAVSLKKTLFALTLACLYVLYRVGLEAIEKRNWRQAIIRLGAFAVAGGWGMALSALLVLPFIEYWGLSWTSHNYGVGFVSFPPAEAVSILVPNFLRGFTGGSGIDGLMNTVPYVGVLVPTLGLLAVVRNAPLTRTAYFFAGFSVLFLCKAYGVPVIQWIGHLPLFSVSIFPKYGSAAFAFSLAVLAGIGLEQVRHGRISRRRLLGAVACIGALLVVFVAVYLPGILSIGRLVYIAFQVGIPAGLLIELVLAFMLATSRKLDPRVTTLTLLGLMVAELFLVLPKDRADRADPYRPPPFIQFLRQDEKPFRLLGLDYILYPDTAAVYGLDDLRNLDAMYLKRYAGFIKAFVDPAFTDRLTGDEALRYGKFLDLANVKYVLSLQPLARWNIAGEHNAPGDSFELVYDGEVKIYRNANAFPRAFVIHSVVSARDDEAALASMSRAGFDPGTQVVIEGAGPETLPIASSPGDDFSTAAVIARTPRYARVQVSTARPGVLVLADSFYPGWVARIDGQDAQIYPADYLFRGVYIESGDHQVEFIYAPSSFQIGASISALALLGVIVSLAYAWCAPRRAVEA